MATEKINYLKLGLGFCWVYTQDSNLYYLWWDLAWPDENTDDYQQRNNQWVSLLKEAIVNNLDVEFNTDSDSDSKVINIKLFTA